MYIKKAEDITKAAGKDYRGKQCLDYMYYHAHVLFWNLICMILIFMKYFT